MFVFCGGAAVLLLFEVAEPTAARHATETAMTRATLPNLMDFEYSAALGVIPLTC
jgi:hypothetical protein